MPAQIQLAKIKNPAAKKQIATLEDAYAEVQKLQSEKDVSTTDLHKAIQAFSEAQNQFHTAVKKEEDPQEKTTVLQQMNQKIAEAQKLPKNARLYKEISGIVRTIENRTTNDQSTVLELKVFSQKLDELLNKQKVDNRAMADDDKDAKKAAETLDAFLEGKPSARCVARIDTKGKVCKISTQNGNDLRILNDGVFNLPITASTEEGITVEIPEKYRSKVGGAKTGQLSLDEKFSLATEISVENVKNIIDVLDMVIENLEPFTEDKGKINFWKTTVTTQHQQKLKKALGTPALEILANASKEDGQLFRLPSSDDLTRSTADDIKRMIKEMKTWKANLYKGIDKKSPDDRVYVGRDGTITK